MESMACNVCGVQKPLSAFKFRNDNKKYRPECRDCHNKIQAARRYDVTIGYIDELRVTQGNKCAICGTHADDIPHKNFKFNPLVIDHDHESGEVRGLLCPTCNAGLGHFKDSPELLAQAIKYLMKSGKEIV